MTPETSEPTRIDVDVDPRPASRLDVVLAPLESLFGRATRGVGRLLPLELNPLAQLGALANFMLLIACITGVLVLFWYVPSHESAFASVEGMADSPLLAGLMRSLHRYSSDAAMLLILMHGLAMLAQRRIGGPRWVAWVTGIVAVGFVWFIGWLGYWLVWDTRAQLVAKGTARALDVVPIFVDPISTSFLTDASVPSLLFFVVFFLHILLPLLLVVALWLHLSRLSRAAWLPARGLAIVGVVSMIVLSFALPATSSDAASMTLRPDNLTGDWWYLLPVMLTERLSGGLLWAVVLGGTILTISMPWWFVRRRAARKDLRPPTLTRVAANKSASTGGEASASATPTEAQAPVEAASAPNYAIAHVDDAKCNACQTCAIDCPFDAIAMMPRTDGRRFPSVAVVDPDRCVGCGICNGSCDSSAIVLPWLPQPAVRSQVDAWLARIDGPSAPAASTAVEPCHKTVRDDDESQLLAAEAEVDAKVKSGDVVVFGCTRSAAGKLHRDAVTGITNGNEKLRVVLLPCAGWLHPMTVERTLRRGAAGVVVASCTPANCTSREGARWTRERLEGRREPELRTEHVDPARLLLIEADADEGRRFIDSLKAFSERVNAPEPRAAPVVARTTSVRARTITLVAAGLVIAAGTWLPSNLPLPMAVSDGPELVVAFKLAGATVEACIERTAAELAALPPHKRVARVCERTRKSIQLVVDVDGQRVVDRVYKAGGAFDDGAARGLEHLTVTPGEHRVTVSLGDEGGDTMHKTEGVRVFAADRAQVLLFDAATGFAWH